MDTAIYSVSSKCVVFSRFLAFQFCLHLNKMERHFQQISYLLLVSFSFLGIFFFIIDDCFKISAKRGTERDRACGNFSENDVPSCPIGLCHDLGKKLASAFIKAGAIHLM